MTHDKPTFDPCMGRKHRFDAHGACKRCGVTPHIVSTTRLYFGTCQTCPHDTGRCNARKATVDDLIEALRADSDVLIIQRDENGEWPKFPDAEPILEALGYDGDWDSAPRASVAIIDVLDALASSQGVEP